MGEITVHPSANKWSLKGVRGNGDAGNKGENYWKCP